MHKLIWRPLAENDLLAIIEHIWEDSPRAAEQLAQDVRTKAEQLRQHPELYRVGRKRGTREMVVHPNYIVIYRIKDETVEILRVKHAAQQWPE